MQGNDQGRRGHNMESEMVPWAEPWIRKRLRSQARDVDLTLTLAGEVPNPRINYWW